MPKRYNYVFAKPGEIKDAMRTILYVEDDPDDRKFMIASIAAVAPRYVLKLQSDYYETIDYLRHQPRFRILVIILNLT